MMSSDKEKEEKDPANDKIKMGEKINAVIYRTVIKDGIKVSERKDVA
jgi:hypothetical protein